MLLLGGNETLTISKQADCGCVVGFKHMSIIIIHQSEYPHCPDPSFHFSSLSWSRCSLFIVDKYNASSAMQHV